jgi:hypothetical protein
MNILNHGKTIKMLKDNIILILLIFFKKLITNFKILMLYKMIEF